MVELLVVIAIIGILASIALISYNRVQNKAKDKAAISEMTQLRTQAQVYYDDNSNTYVGLDADSDVLRIATSIADHGGTGFVINPSATAWAAEVTLPGGDIYCVDSNGSSKVIAASIGIATACD